LGPLLNPIEQVFAKLKTLLRKTDPAQPKPPGAASATFSTASLDKNAPITSQMQDIPQPKPAKPEPNRLK
jgi:transposase